jgi:hypothetical protein
LLKRIAAVAQRQNMSRLDLEGCVDLPNSGLGVATLQENDAEQMQAVEMPRLCRENLPVYFFRIAQSAGLMQRQRLRKCLGRRRGAGHLPRGEKIGRLLVHECRLDDAGTVGVNATTARRFSGIDPGTQIAFGAARINCGSRRYRR